MPNLTVKQKIAVVYVQLEKWLMPDEFADENVTVADPAMPGFNTTLRAKQYVGCSIGTLGRRMREMVEEKTLVRRIREGKTYAEFTVPAVAQELERQKEKQAVAV